MADQSNSNSTDSFSSALKNVQKYLKDIDDDESLLDHLNLLKQINKIHRNNVDSLREYQHIESDITVLNKEILRNEQRIKSLGAVSIIDKSRMSAEEQKIHDLKLAAYNSLTEQNVQLKIQVGYNKQILEDDADKIKSLTNTVTMHRAIRDIIHNTVKYFDMYDSLVEKVAYKLGLGRLDAEKMIPIYQDTLDEVKSIGASIEDAMNASESFVDIIGLVGVRGFKELNENAIKFNKAFGISYETSAKFASSLSEISNTSLQSQKNMAAIARDAAEASGVRLPSVMNDVANVSDDVRSIFRGSTEQLIQQSAELIKINSSLASAASSAKALLNFQASFQSELKASALLGTRLNLNEARRLFFQGKIKEGEVELVKQIKSAGDFTTMNFLQRQAIAESVGKTVGEVQKLIVQDKNLYDIENKFPNLAKEQLEIKERLKKLNGDDAAQRERMLQLTVRDNVAATRSNEIAQLKERIFQNIGKILQPLGKVLYEIGRLTLGFIEKITRLGASLSDIISTVLGGAGLLVSLGLVSVAMIKLKHVIGGLIMSIGKGLGDGIKSLMKSLSEGISKLNIKSILMGAVAIGAIAASLYLLGKSIQTFSNGPDAIELLKYAGAMTVFATAIGVMGAGPIPIAIFLGSAALTAMSLAMSVFSNSITKFPKSSELKGIGSGLQSLSLGMISLVGSAISAPLSWIGVSSISSTIRKIGESAEKYSENINRLGLGFKNLTENILALTNNSSQINSVFDTLNKLSDIGDFDGSFKIEISDSAKATLDNFSFSTETITDLTNVVKSGNAKMTKLLADLISSLESGKIAINIDGQLVNRTLAQSRINRGVYGTPS